MGNSTDTPNRSSDGNEPESSLGAKGKRDERPAAQSQKTHKILVDADKRDHDADIRDAESDKRAEAADLEAFLNTGETYSGHGERRAAALDRSHAKSDRESSADDRAHLTEKNDDPDAEGTSS